MTEPFLQSYIESLTLPLTSVLTAASLILLTAVYYWIKNRGVLPGPKSLPYLGLYPILTEENVLSKLEEYKKKYGDIFSFTYTGRLYINLGSIKAMREIQLQKSDCFADRWDGSHILMEMVKNGLLGVNGEAWKNLRKFFIQKFKEYGLNAVRDDLAGPLYDSLNAAIENLKALHNHPINILEFLSQHCALTIRKTIFGEKGVTDEEITNMIIAFGGALDGHAGINLLLIGPFAKFLFYTKSKFRENMRQIKIMKSVILKCVKRIESSMSDDEATSIVEEFYQEERKRRQRNDESYKYFTDEALVESLFQLVGDGIATVAAFIAGMFNDLLEHPEEQDKLYSEIIDVVGHNRQPTAEDRPNLPYTNAYLNEYVRTSKFLIFFLSLQCTKETTVRGFRVPKGSITLMNFCSAHHDEKTFEDPYTFNPSRYLVSSGKPKTEFPVLFGMGKRACTGEPFVMLQTFLFLTTVVKSFKVVSSNAQYDKSIDFLITGKLELTFAPRKEI